MIDWLEIVSYPNKVVSRLISMLWILLILQSFLVIINVCFPVQELWSRKYFKLICKTQFEGDLSEIGNLICFKTVTFILNLFPSPLPSSVLIFGSVNTCGFFRHCILCWKDFKTCVNSKTYCAAYEFVAIRTNLCFVET